jgi:hypothetical protein
MILEFLLGFIISIFLIYLWILYLKWGDSIGADLELYNYNNKLIKGPKKEVIETWGWAAPSPILYDTYKYVNFWMLYYSSKYTT